ncbi:LOW QUALITY PROTEIN: hepatocyte cell adhesion molecule [Xyrauchen texanus]|uniref:LOW QUALITY PROTEIN: hepatocyte cell adhesion molecule n=1 Tax=Xyrauchen texanus TaxID=154827 RepID=UPI002241DBEF|nr:LOW QUALITY PROTEIN: hepatocyte cell adhesion molecule [Xyrauchen texanus]
MVHMFVLSCLCSWHLVGVFLVDTDEMKTVSVMEGDSVTLKTGVTKIREDDLIMWTCGDSCIAKLNVSAQIISESNEKFRGRLHLDYLTGSLTITNITTADSGLYKAQIIGNKVSRKSFNVTVNANLPIPVIIRYCPQYSPSSESLRHSKCVLVCSVVNVHRLTLSWCKGNSLLSSISVSDLNSLSLPLEVEYQENNIYSCVINNPIRNQTKHLDITEVCQPCSDSVCCCDFPEAVIRLVVSALMGVAAVAAIVVLVYDIRSRRSTKNISSEVNTSPSSMEY